MSGYTDRRLELEEKVKRLRRDQLYRLRRQYFNLADAATDPVYADHLDQCAEIVSHQLSELEFRMFRR